MVPRASEHDQLGLFGDEPVTEAGAGAGRATARGDVEPAPASAEISELAARLPESIRLGTSSWSFSGWAGIVYKGKYAQSALAKDGLAAYAQHPLLRAVGIDRTFYAPISAQDFAAYAAVVPEGFRFLVKAHESCTMARYPMNPRYGKRKGQPNELFLNAAYAAEQVVWPFLDGLGDKAGPLVFQLPPQGLEDLGGAAGFPEKLHRFLAALPKGPHYAVEIRNKELLTEAYAQCLASVGTSHCITIHPKMPDAERQWLVTGGDPRAPGLVVRWMLSLGMTHETAADAFAPFDEIAAPDDESRDALVDLALRADEMGHESLIVVNNKAEGSAPLSVVRLAQAIDGRIRDFG